MPNQRRFKSSGIRHAYERYIGKDAARVASFEEDLAGADIASQIYRLRTRAGISQRQLAARVGTTASVICRLEDADYEGHSLSLLRRIAVALGKRIQIHFVPARRRRAPARGVA